MCDGAAEAQKLCEALCSQPLTGNGLLRDAVVLQIKQQFSLCSPKEQLQYLCSKFSRECEITDSEEVRELTADSCPAEKRTAYRKLVTSLQMCVSLLCEDDSQRTVDDAMQMRELQNFVSQHFSCFLDSALADFRISLQQIANSVRALEIAPVNDEPAYRKINFCNDMLA